MSVSADYRRLLRREVKIRTLINKSFKKQRAFLEAHVEDLYENYKFNIELTRNNLNDQHVHLYPEKSRNDIENNEPLGGFRKEMGVEDLIYDIKPQIKKSAERGYKKSFRILQPLLAKNGFTYYPDTIDNYANYRGELELSNFKGTITHTTKHDVIQILKNGIDNNLTVSEVADQINKLDDRLFSPARANTIAVSEVGKAYEYGNYMPVKQLASVGVPMKKKRETCHDSRVRPEHREAEEEGRVNLDYIYPSVGVAIAPGGPNCRCTMLYDIAD